MTAAVQNIHREPFTMIANSCFGHTIFDNIYQEVVYMTLKKFADSNNQCFPGLKTIARAALISKRKVQSTLKELKDKFLINIQSRFKADGSQTSNLYTIYDLPKLWTAGNAENIKNTENTESVKNIENAGNTDNKTETIIKQYKEFMSMLEAEGYVLVKKDDLPAGLQDGSTLKPASDTIPDNIIMAQDESVEETVEVMPEDVAVQEKEPVLNNAVTIPEKGNHTTGKKIMSKLKNITRKEKEPTSAPTKVTDVSTTNKLSKNDDTTSSLESQPLEKYPLDWIKNYFGYDAMIDKYPEYQKNIDSVMNILHTTLNTTNKIIRIKGDKKPSTVVKSKLLKLEKEDIIYAIKTFLNQKLKIKNTTAYMVSLLYNAPEQRQLEMENTKQYETAKKNGQASEPDGTQPVATSSPIPLSRDIYPKNQFNQFMERRTTAEELDELERKLLGNNMSWLAK